MPEKKDFVSVKQGEQRIHIQKRLFLSNLREVYQLFKDKFPTETVGFSKFADLQPKHCILAGASGTHSVCVCITHQNVKLMMLGVNLSELTAQNDIPLSNISQLPSTNDLQSTPTWMLLGYLWFCPGITRLRDELLAIMEDNMIDTVVFKQWVSVDRSTLETVIKSADQFVESFCEKLEHLLPHSFVAMQQASFYKDCKSTLQPGELLVNADFSENYSFILQDAAQGFHWNNSQATIHPFVAYYTLTRGSCAIWTLSSSLTVCSIIQLLYICSKKRWLLIWKESYLQILKKSTTFLMEQHPNTKIARISWICAVMKKILECVLNGIFLQPLTAKVLVMALEALLNALLKDLACRDNMTNK